MNKKIVYIDLRSLLPSGHRSLEKSFSQLLNADGWSWYHAWETGGLQPRKAIYECWSHGIPPFIEMKGSKPCYLGCASQKNCQGAQTPAPPQNHDRCADILIATLILEWSMIHFFVQGLYLGWWIPLKVGSAPIIVARKVGFLLLGNLDPRAQFPEPEQSTGRNLSHSFCFHFQVGRPDQYTR